MPKLMTLNTHSLEEKEMDRKQQIFADTVSELLPDVIALQEVNQLSDSAPESEIPETCVPVQKAVPLKAGNHALQVSRLLEANGTPYYWAWLPIKVGYDKYDEGVALFSRKPILETADLPLSMIQDFSNYRTRRLLGIRTEDGWFFSVHTSWWNDPDEPFLHQWEEMQKAAKTRKPAVLMGDFNGDAMVRNETYDRIAKDGWYDSYVLAKNKDAGWTVAGTIDGWHDQEAADARRIDQIWLDQPMTVKSSEVIFNGDNYPVISDHFGILIETE